MKIPQSSDIAVNSLPPSQTTGAAAAKAAQQTPAATAAREASSAGVAVTVSARARALEQTKSTESPEVDTAKVNEVRAAIDNGTYVVNPGVIADKLLANAKDMLNRTQT
jgi:negative regulator of flagellin synthesis FlgM